MKLELLTECVSRLAECDIDNPADQKTISVCENYIMESYDYYLESCEINGYEPLSKTEYMQEIMLNEGFLKKLLGFGAAAGAAAGAIHYGRKLNTAGKAMAQRTGMDQNAGFIARTKNLYKNAGNIGNTANLVRNSKANLDKTNKIWDKHMQQNTAYSKNDQGDLVQQKSMRIDRNADATNTLTTVKGKTIDANSNRGQIYSKAANAKIEKQNKKQQEQTNDKSGTAPANGNTTTAQTGAAPANGNTTPANGKATAPSTTPANVAQARAVATKLEAKGTNRTPEETEQLNQIRQLANKNGWRLEESFIASDLQQPLTGAIRMPTKYQ